MWIPQLYHCLPLLSLVILITKVSPLLFVLQKQIFPSMKHFVCFFQTTTTKKSSKKVRTDTCCILVYAARRTRSRGHAAETWVKGVWPSRSYLTEPFPRAAPVEALGFSAGTFAVTVSAAVLPWFELKEKARVQREVSVLIQLCLNTCCPAFQAAPCHLMFTMPRCYQPRCTSTDDRSSKCDIVGAPGSLPAVWWV